MKYNVSFSLELKKNPYPGRFIALEGIDGSGKTVQAERLSEHFRDKGRGVLMVSEPRRTGLIGRVINEFLQKRIKFPSASLQHLFSADRISHQEEIIIPALQRGEVVISHRCFWSAIPYGIMDRSEKKYNYEAGDVLLVAQSVLSMYHQIMVPDVTFYLNVSADTALDRLIKMGIPREYYETKEKLINVKRGYDWLIQKFPKEITVVDGERRVGEVTEEIIRKISNF